MPDRPLRTGGALTTVALAVVFTLVVAGSLRVDQAEAEGARQAVQRPGRAAPGGTAGEPPSWPDEARLFGSDQAQFWNFARDVALDTDTALVGANGADIGGATDRGAAYIYVRQGESWVEQIQLLASDGAAGDWFGYSVALRGDQAVVGAPRAAVGGEIAEGAVYAFEHSDGRWTEVQKLVASDGDDLDWLGYSVALDGDTLLAGAINEEGAIGSAMEGCQGSGAAYVFVRQGGLWAEQAKLFDPQGECADVFGNDVALQADTALIGAESALIGGDPNRGAAYVYTRVAGTWLMEAKLLASDGAEPDQFGWSVALDRDTALVGAQQKIIDGNPRQGAAYVFRRSGTTWTEEQRLTASDGHAEANFGIGAALLGNLALVGAEFNFPGDPERGVVYEYRDQGGTWIEIQKFAAPQGNEFDAFGQAISLTPERVLVSHRNEFVLPPGGGSAWIFRRPTLFEDGFESGDTSGWDQVVTGEAPE